jgi:hypothetical protein
MNRDVLHLETLVPGDRFLRIGVPHFVWIKTSHNWAHAWWKGVCHQRPMHHLTLVRRAPSIQLNPGEVHQISQQ